MKIRAIKSFAIALVTLLGFGAANGQSDNSDWTKEEHSELIQTLNEISESSFFDASILNNKPKVFVYTLDGELLLETKGTELDEKQLKVIFQSNLVMELEGSQYYIKQLQSSPVIL